MADPRPPGRGERPRRTHSDTYRIVRPPPPIAGFDYPRTTAEFHGLYPDESACRSALERLRWPGGYRCPRCGRRDSPFRSGLLMGCPRCGVLDAITATTLFHGTAKPLQQWFLGLWEAAGQRYGTDLSGLQRVFEIRNPKTAWEYLARLHGAMERASQEPLRGTVEVARCYLDIPDPSPEGSAPAVVAIAAAQLGAGLGRARLRALGPVTAAAMTHFVRDGVSPGTKVRTGSWHGYARLQAAGFAHDVRPARRPGRGHTALLPCAQAVAQQLRRWLWSTRSVTRAHLDSYLHEFEFRFARRTCTRGVLFYQLLRAAVPMTRELRPRTAPARSVATS